jgi:hypothetical protein
MGEAIETTSNLYPGLLEHNQNLLFLLKCRQFVEMVNGSDSEVCPPRCPRGQGIFSPLHPSSSNTPPHPTSPVQTSVIQSTKSYGNNRNRGHSSTVEENNLNKVAMNGSNGGIGDQPGGGSSVIRPPPGIGEESDVEMEPPEERNGHTVVNKAVSPATNGYQNGSSLQQDKEELDDVEDMGE